MSVSLVLTIAMRLQHALILLGASCAPVHQDSLEMVSFVVVCFSLNCSGHHDAYFSTADTDECEFGTDSCSENAACVNAVGSYICSCLGGYSGDGRACDSMLQ